MKPFCLAKFHGMQSKFTFKHKTSKKSMWGVFLLFLWCPVVMGQEDVESQRRKWEKRFSKLPYRPYEIRDYQLKIIPSGVFEEYIHLKELKIGSNIRKI